MYDDHLYDAFERGMKTSYPELCTNIGYEIGPGWYGLVGTLIGQIHAHVKGNNCFRERLLKDNHQKLPIPEYMEWPTIVQIKEKFGALRFYCDGTDKYIDGLIDMAETMSTQICEKCGNVGHVRKGGWLVTLCDKHYQERLERMNDYTD